MGLLTKDAILGAADIAEEEVDVPEWNGTVLVRALTGTERDAFEASLRQQRGKDVLLNTANARAKLVARSIIDPETGARMFADNEINALGKKSAAALDRVFTVAARLSRLDEEDIEELGKSTETDQNGDSTSA